MFNNKLDADILKAEFKTSVLRSEIIPPIALSEIKRAINAHPKELDEDIQNIAIQACRMIENKYGRSIFFKVLAHVHKRNVIVLPYPYIRDIKSVEIKNKRKWEMLDIGNSEAVEILYSINHSGDAVVTINANWQDNQEVRVKYEVGHKLDDQNIQDIDAKKHLMDPCLKNAILIHCRKLYDTHYKNNYNESDKNNIKNNKNNTLDYDKSYGSIR